ncbi:hypothetical protein [Helicobacter suis]|uniref:hypothetical protein n=1 Tax=Helicobacter suis TaxID=104628 RepID=UPI0013CF5CCA|nr:hypothetical protein [Helicobacter suis]
MVFHHLIRAGGGVAIALLISGCSAKLGSINPNQPLTEDMRPVLGHACKHFTWIYGKAHDEDLKQEAMQQVTSQANNYARAANAKEAELVNVKITKHFYPWFSLLVGSKCVNVKGFARPKTQ